MEEIQKRRKTKTIRWNFEIDRPRSAYQTLVITDKSELGKVIMGNKT